jgi:hypothetical protein
MLDSVTAVRPKQAGEVSTEVIKRSIFAAVRRCRIFLGRVRSGEMPKQLHTGTSAEDRPYWTAPRLR